MTEKASVSSEEWRFWKIRMAARIESGKAGRAGS